MPAFCFGDDLRPSRAHSTCSLCLLICLVGLERVEYAKYIGPARQNKKIRQDSFDTWLIHPPLIEVCERLLKQKKPFEYNPRKWQKMRFA